VTRFRIRPASRWQALSLVALATLTGTSPAATLDAALLRAAESAPQPVLLRLADPPPARPPVTAPFEVRVAATVQALQAAATHRQRDLRAALQARGVPHRAFWVANAVAATVDAPTLRWLATRRDVASIEPDARASAPLPRPQAVVRKQQAAIEWGVMRVNAPQVWAMGYVGQGVVLAGADSGYQWDHPALREAYRGWDGESARHDHHWHDAILSGAANDCGFASAEPCDDSGHGTHTLGTMLGDDGAGNQVGVAPGARWIGCRNMNQGDGTVSSYLDCFQWFLAPTDLAGNDPQPALAPHVINNSWLCTTGEGCVLPGTLDEAVANTHAAGILVVVAAGNAGPACSTMREPPALHPQAFSVGATTSSNAIADFSSRGPVTIDGSGRLKPDAAAPGFIIRSSVREGQYGLSSGTSMAAPHVAGVAALMMSANPALRGDPGLVAQLLRQTAVASTSIQDCGAFPGAGVPNAVFGHGRVDALAAVQAALALSDRVFRNGFEG
jgi:serine protease AprX